MLAEESLRVVHNPSREAGDLGAIGRELYAIAEALPPTETLKENIPIRTIEEEGRLWGAMLRVRLDAFCQLWRIIAGGHTSVAGAVDASGEPQSSLSYILVDQVAPAVIRGDIRSLDQLAGALVTTITEREADSANLRDYHGYSDLDGALAVVTAYQEVLKTGL
jgi:hypothetical protein